MSSSCLPLHGIHIVISLVLMGNASISCVRLLPEVAIVGLMLWKLQAFFLALHEKFRGTCRPSTDKRPMINLQPCNKCLRHQMARWAQSNKHMQGVVSRATDLSLQAWQHFLP